MGKFKTIIFALLLCASSAEASLCSTALQKIQSFFKETTVEEERATPPSNLAMNIIEYSAGTNFRTALLRYTGFFENHEATLQATREYVPQTGDLFPANTTISMLNHLYYEVLKELPVVISRELWGPKVSEDSAIPISIFALIEAIKLRIPRDRIRTAWMVHTPEGYTAIRGNDAADPNASRVDRTILTTLIIKGPSEEWYAMDPNTENLLTLTDWYEQNRTYLGVDQEEITAESRRLAFGIWEAGYTSFVGGVEIPKSAPVLFLNDNSDSVENPKSHLHTYYRDYFETQPPALQWTHGGHGGVIRTPPIAHPRSPERLDLLPSE